LSRPIEGFIMSSNKDELTRSKQQEPEQGKVIIEDDSLLSKGFTQVPNVILRDPSLSDGAKLTYAMLLSYAWSDNSSFPGQERLAEHLGKERKAVIRYIQELKNRKLVRVERRGLGLTNIYYIRTTLEADVPSVGHQEVPSGSHQEVPRKGHKEYEVSNNTQNKEYTDLSKGKALKTQKEGRGDDQVTTYSHSERSTIRNETNRRSNIEPTLSRSRREEPQSISQIMQGRVAAMQVASPSTPPPNVTQPPSRLKGNWKKAPIFIQAMIEDWFAPELHDQAIHSSITRTHKLYLAFVKAAREKYGEQATPEMIEDAFREGMMAARAKAKKANIKTLTAKGWPNRMPYFFACLEKSLELPSSEPN
jgi:hypothetical protein